MEEISIRELFLILVNRKKLILLITIISIITSGIVSYFILTPQYETFTTLMVGKPKDYGGENQLEYNDLLLNQKLVGTYGQIVKSRLVADEVIEQMGLDLTFEEFGSKVNVNLLQDTEIIKIEVTDEKPQVAAAIANVTSEVFMKTVKEKMKIENIQVIDEAQTPERPIKPRPKLNMAIAGVLGLMISIFVIFLMEALDNTIKTPEDVEYHLELPIIGTIPMMEE